MPRQIDDYLIQAGDSEGSYHLGTKTYKDSRVTSLVDVESYRVECALNGEPLNHHFDNNYSPRSQTTICCICS